MMFTEVTESRKHNKYHKSTEVLRKIPILIMKNDVIFQCIFQIVNLPSFPDIIVLSKIQENL